MANKRVITSDMFSDDKFMFFDDFTHILWVGLITVCADYKPIEKVEKV